ncbi:MAG: MGMT family protein [Pseudomonadota bacterium]
MPARPPGPPSPSATHDAPEAGLPPLNAAIYRMVARVPPGRVATYGQIASLLGRCGPRQVGTALSRIPAGHAVPWQRIVNARGEISARRDGSGSPEQRTRLESEGVVFDSRGRIDLQRFGWSREEMLWAVEEHTFLGDEDEPAR